MKRKRQHSRQIPMRFTPAVLLAGSKLFLDYQRAFAAATDLWLVLLTPDSRQLTEDEGANPRSESPGFGPESCASRRVFQQELVKADQRSVQTRECYAGLCETIVPVRTKNRVIALLRVGHVRLRAPSPDEVEKVSAVTSAKQDSATADEIEASLLRVPYIPPERYAAMVELIEIFARQLAEWYSQYKASTLSREFLTIQESIKWIKVHYREDLTLAAVAKEAQMSRWQFSRSFHLIAGTKFNLFLAQTRVAHARSLLAKSQTMIREIALDVGFQSLARFNRRFYQIVGKTPGEFRAKSAVLSRTKAGAAIESRPANVPLQHAL